MHIKLGVSLYSLFMFSGVARILLKGVLKLNGQLAGHSKAEAFDFFNIELV